MARERASANSSKIRTAAFSVLSNSALVVLKLVAGILMGSVAVISEAIHSGIDLLAALIAFFSVRAAAKPSDKEHPYGHEKIENISGTIEALLIFGAAAWIIYKSIQKLVHLGPVEELGWGMAVMGISAVANWLVSRILFRVSQQTDSVALAADAWHLRTDVYTSAGVMLALAVISAGEYLAPSTNLFWIDPVVAILVALLITQAAYHLTRSSVRDLIDERLPDEEEQWIRDLVETYKPTARGMHSLRTRKASAARFIDFHVYVDSAMSVAKSHALSHSIAKAIREHFPQSTVTIHVEPSRIKYERHKDKREEARNAERVN